jgi:hypothetical protein
MTKDEALQLAVDTLEIYGSQALTVKKVITQLKKVLSQEQILGLDVVVNTSLPENTFKLVKGNPYLKFVDFNKV